MQKKILFIGLIWPEPNSSAAGTRILQLIQLFQQIGYQVTFVSSAEKTEFSVDLPNVIQHHTQLNSNEFNKWLKEKKFDIVLFDRFVSEEQFGWRVREVMPNTLTLLDTEDLHFLRFAREQQLKQNSTYLSAFLYSELTKREIASILRCDLSLIISKAEIDLLVTQFQISKTILSYLPLFPPTIEINTNFIERKNFIFIGNCLHKPNTDAILQLKQEIWPQIREKLPDVELHIYGAYITQQIQELNDKKTGFLIKGRAITIDSVFPNYRVLLAPLRFGAGQKGKLIEATAYDLPTVTSSIGAEGIASKENWNGFVTDNWKDFSEKAIELYANEELWEQASKKGKQILETEFDSKNLNEQFLNQLKLIQANLQKHREKNFLGQIINSNTLNTYKYMSKWIELKNKI